MNDAEQKVMLAIVLILAIIVAVTLPLLTLWRLRTPARRRDEWLGATAQPRLTALAHGLGVVTSVGGALACALVASAGYPFLWAPVALFAGLLVSTIISATAAFRTPAELD